MIYDEEGKFIDHDKPRQVLWRRVQGGRWDRRWRTDGEHFPTTELLLVRKGPERGWRITSESRQWSVTRDGLSYFKITESSGAAGTAIGTKTDPMWDAGRLQIGERIYRWRPDDMSGTCMCFEDGPPILRDSGPWKDSQIDRGVVRITTLLEAADQTPDLPFLAGFAFSLWFYSATDPPYDFQW